MNHGPQEVVVTTKNSASFILGIVGVVMGAIALVFGWMPYLGLLSIPVAVIGGVFAFIGLVISLFKHLQGLGVPVIGLCVCVVAVLVPIFSTGGASKAISAQMDEYNRAASEETEKREAKESQEELEKYSYIDQGLQLYDVSAEYKDSLLDGEVAGVLFKIKNVGDRSLDEVEVTVYFKDSEGNVIAEEDYHPVLVTEYSFGADNKPLKPGYIWQMEKGKFYSAKSVPSEWQEGNVEAEITEISFSDEGE